MIEMTIESIRESLVNGQNVVMLKEKKTGRYLPIWIGSPEAQALAIALKGITVPRPLTHDILKTTIDVLGGIVNYVVINELKNDTFFALISVTIGENNIEIDARPSDAMVLAVKMEVPVYADEKVLEKAGIFVDRELLDETESTDVPEDIAERRKKASEDEINKLSAFRDFIENDLDLEDFDKRKS